MRRGKPCAAASGSPFIATVTIAFLPSSAISAGTPALTPSTGRPSPCVAFSLQAGPVHQVRERHALPARVPDGRRRHSGAVL